MPVTVIEAGPCQRGAGARRAAVQLGFGARARQARATEGRSWATRRRPGSTAAPQVLREFDAGAATRPRAGRRGQGRTSSPPGELVKVTGTSKGRGLPGRGAPPRLRRRSGHARQHAAPEAGLDRPGHRPVARHQGQADAGPHGRGAAHRAGPPRRARWTPSGTCCSCGARCRAPTNGIVTVRKQGGREPP